MTWFGYIYVAWMLLLLFGLINGIKSSSDSRVANTSMVVVMLWIASIFGVLFVGTGHIR